MIISNTGKRIIGILGGVLLLTLGSLYFFISPEETDLLPKCPVLVTTGYYCTGCGSQRALHDLLHLDFIGVLNHNLLFLPALAIVFYHGAVKWLEHKNGRTYQNFLYHRKTPIIVLLIVVLFTLLRNLESYPFNLLAP